jgi:hypothetical protein
VPPQKEVGLGVEPALSLPKYQCPPEIANFTFNLLPSIFDVTRLIGVLTIPNHAIQKRY